MGDWPGWRRVRFGEVAECVNDRVDDPSAAGVERYVGLDHLDPESLSIARWGTPDEVESTKLRFRAGDIIFGKRRAYQRKLALADFDGICSAHAMVLRARPGKILSEFLPFFMQSDTFMERAVAISVGSLSPTINWKTLAGEEFALPPLDEQRRIHRLALATVDTWQSLKHAHDAAVMTEASAVEHVIASISERTVLGKHIADVAYGSSAQSNQNRKGLPILRIPNVLRGDLDLTDLQWQELGPAEQRRFGVTGGDVLLVRTNGNPEYVGRSVVVPDGTKDMLFASYLLRVRTGTSLLPHYLSIVLNAPSTRRHLRGSVRSSAGNYNINTSGIRNLQIPFCPIKVQRTIIDEINQLRSMREMVQRRMSDAAELHRRVLREALS